MQRAHNLTQWDNPDLQWTLPRLAAEAKQSEHVAANTAKGVLNTQTAAEACSGSFGSGTNYTGGETALIGQAAVGSSSHTDQEQVQG